MSGPACFGKEFSVVLVDGCAALGVPPDWPLAVIALESGFDPTIYHGRNQAVALDKAPADWREVEGLGVALPRNCTGASGLWQKMPQRLKRDGKRDLLRLYCSSVRDPAQQLREAIRFWGDWAPPGGWKSREHFYASNLAPAYAKESAEVLYPAGSAGAKANLYLDVDQDGSIEMSELGTPLDRAVRQCRTRYECELDAAYAWGNLRAGV